MEKIVESKIEQMIFIIRGHKVMLDSDLAELYGVKTKVLNQAARRNKERFPTDFMFQLNAQEYVNLRSQFVTSSFEHGGRRAFPVVFTENGVAMLSSVLKSKRAISVNISIMRTFTKLRKFLASDGSLSDRVDKLEKGTDKLFKIVFERLDHIDLQIEEVPKTERKRVGF